MRNFQGIIFTWIWVYGEIFKSALVYLQGFSLELNERIMIETVMAGWIRKGSHNGYMPAVNDTLTSCATLLIEDKFSNIMDWHLEIQKTSISPSPMKTICLKTKLPSVRFKKCVKTLMSLSCMVSHRRGTTKIVCGEGASFQKMSVTMLAKW